MVRGKVVIQGTNGIHLRPAGELANEGMRHPCDIELIRDGKTVNGKSLLSILSLGIQEGYEVEVVCDGKGEQEALDAYLKILSGI